MSPERCEGLSLHAPEVIEEEDSHNMEAKRSPFSSELVNHMIEGDDGIVDPEADKADLERKCVEVLEEQHCQLQKAANFAMLRSRQSAEEDIMEFTMHERELALKAMGPMDKGDVILGSGAEGTLLLMNVLLCILY
ncbi:hypothetical protein L7F22_016635 [Adiantum nelumboides]|nr:hypothetical protein [Adiantum nelumboides]